MLLRDENGFDHEAVITTNHAASSYGVPVLVVEAQALGPVEAGGYRVAQATDDELAALVKGNYLRTPVRGVRLGWRIPGSEHLGPVRP